MTISIYEKIHKTQGCLIVFDSPIFQPLDHLTDRILIEGEKVALKNHSIPGLKLISKQRY
jgi:hypothetical protein